ncbi:hypothetical protein VTN02DRAFT_720 [Thermoascus thermophilus]
MRAAGTSAEQRLPKTQTITRATSEHLNSLPPETDSTTLDVLKDGSISPRVANSNWPGSLQTTFRHDFD